MNYSNNKNLLSAVWENEPTLSLKTHDQSQDFSD